MEMRNPPRRNVCVACTKPVCAYVRRLTSFELLSKSTSGTVMILRHEGRVQGNSFSVA